MKRVLLLSVAALLMAACSESPTGPAAAKKTPSVRANHDIFCESGYVVAFDENGNPICVPDPNGDKGHFRASVPPDSLKR